MLSSTFIYPPLEDRSTYQYRLISTTKQRDTCSEVSLYFCLEKGYLFILVNLPERVGLRFLNRRNNYILDHRNLMCSRSRLIQRELRFWLFGQLFFQPDGCKILRNQDQWERWWWERWWIFLPCWCVSFLFSPFNLFLCKVEFTFFTYTFFIFYIYCRVFRGTKIKKN